jgi:phosphate transport system permease protein
MKAFFQRPGVSVRASTDYSFQILALLCISFALFVLGALLLDLLIDAWPRLSYQFLSSFPSRFPNKAGVLSALVGSVSLMLLTGAISVPIGVGAAIYLEEYASKTRLTQLIELNIANLAGVPSIIYGILGLQLFVRYLNLDRSLLAGALTMSLLVLPIIIIAAREALRTVPKNLREAALALGATKWQTIWHQVLPSALPGILTGCILAFSRAIGEAAPLITIGALTYIAFLPDSLFSAFSVLPIQAFNWLSRPQSAFHANAAAAIILLLAILLCMNSLAIWLRYKFEKRYKRS